MAESDLELLARIDELAGQMAQLKGRLRAQLPQGALSVVVVRLESEHLSLALGAVECVLAMARLECISTRLACPSLLGLLRFADESVPVLCLRSLLGFPPPCYSRATSIVLISQGDRRRGLVVDEVEGLAEFPADRLSSPDATLPNRHLLWGILGQESQARVLLLNHLALLDLNLTIADSEPAPPDS